MDSSAPTYQDFIVNKRRTYAGDGFDVPIEAINPQLFPFQRDIVRWALRKGRAALFADCGLGKTPMQLEWSRHVHLHTGQDVLILAPLAVAQQTKREGEKFGVPVTVCRTQADVRQGVNITNYERLDHFDPDHFAGIVLDESSLLKSYMGATKRKLISAFSLTPYRLCATATPAPNDHMELGNHAEFLGIMPSPEMLARWFINDTMHFGTYRLKGHAAGDFWDWVASWAISMRRPSDLGYADDGFALPPLNLHHEVIRVDLTQDAGDMLFRIPTISATGMHKEMRLTAPERAQRAADLVNGNDDFWIVWCNTNYEADELVTRIPGAVEVRGPETIEAKERKLLAFSNGETRVIISKPSLAGFGLNWQHCNKVVFVGLSYSFEQFYQAVRRSYRFGQTRPVEAFVVAAETEGQIVETVLAKMREHEALMEGMNRSAMKLALSGERELTIRTGIETVSAPSGKWTMHLGDCVTVAKTLPDDSLHFVLHSPPFSSLYIYSDDLQDMGNSSDDAEFFRHYGYLIPELYRALMPGRLCAVHCKQLVNYKGRDGMAGLRDFRGDIIRAFTARGFAYHSEVCIWKDPVIEMQRTKAHGLLYKQLRADSTFSRQGLAEYLLLFRKWPESDDTPIEPVTHTHDSFPLEMWQRYASPVWNDIRQTNVLNVQAARDDQDEKHICPLQLDLIERALTLWTNPGDLVYDPFAGIGSTGYVGLPLGRRFVGSELKDSYHRQAVANLRRAEQAAGQPTLFDLLPAEQSIA